MKQRILVDLNVLLDVLAERQPHYRSSAQIWSLAERGMVIGMVDYIVTRDLKHFGKSHLPVRTPEEFLLTAKF